MSDPEFQPPPCGNPECCCSTGIHDDDGLTFGSGELDAYGYWETPCAICAREHERRDGKPTGAYWPFSEEHARRLAARAAREDQDDTEENTEGAT